MNLGKTMASIVITVVVVCVAIIALVVDQLKHYIVCTFTLGLAESCNSKDKDPITEDEMKTFINNIIEARKEAIAKADNNDAEMYGQGKLGGGVPNGSYQTTCGPYKGDFADLINKYAAEYQVDPQLIAAIIKQESQFDPNAQSGVGAAGLMQLMPSTAAELGVTDRFDPEQSIRGGTKYIRKLLDMRNGDVKLALASYNWGAGNVNNALDRYNAKTWDDIIAAGGGNSETNEYVTKVTGYYDGYKKDGAECGDSGNSDGYSTTWKAGTSDKITAAALDSFFQNNLRGIGRYVVQYGQEYQMDPVFVAAIMMHETGNGTNYKSTSPYYNFGGIKCASQASQNEFGFTCKYGSGGSKVNWSAFPNQDVGVKYMNYLLRQYANQGLDTVGDVQPKYCPPSDAGCSDWQNGVNANINKIYQLAGVTNPGGTGSSTPSPTPPAGGGDAGGTGSNSDNPNGDLIVQTALDLLKQYGGKVTYSQSVRDIPGRLMGDCSTWVNLVFETAGMGSLGGYTKLQIANESGQFIKTMDQLAPGDVVFFKRLETGPASHYYTDPTGDSYYLQHTGVYIGIEDGKHMMIDLGNSGLKKSSMDVSYWQSRFVGARRFTQPGTSSGNTFTPGEGVLSAEEEASLHIRALLSSEYFAISGLDLSNRVRNGENINDILDYKNGEYAGTELAKTWLIADKLKDYNGKWSIEDKLINARFEIWQCYFVGDVDRFWFWQDDQKSCNEINQAISDATNGQITEFIPEDYQGVVLRLIETKRDVYECFLLPPKQPTGFGATSKSETSITLGWNSDRFASKYQLLRGNTVIYEGSGTSYTISGLDADTSYSFTLIAINEEGKSPAASVSVKTDAPPPPPDPTQPDDPNYPGPGGPQSAASKSNQKLMITTALDYQKANVILAADTWEKEVHVADPYKPPCDTASGGYELKKVDTVVQTEVKYKSLIYDILFGFERFSLLQKDKTYFRDEDSYKEMIKYYLEEEYENIGMTPGNVGIVQIPVQGTYQLPILPFEQIPGAGKGDWTITSEFGPRIHPITGEAKMHNGIDMAPTSHQPGTPVRAAADGKVTWSGFNTSMGNSVIIDHNTGFGTRYMHMSSNLTVHIGDQVKKGQVIGYMNTTGDSTGVHLHFEICGTIEGAKCTNQVNPRQALDFPPMGTLAKDYYDPSLDTSGK